MVFDLLNCKWGKNSFLTPLFDRTCAKCIHIDERGLAIFGWHHLDAKLKPCGNQRQEILGRFLSYYIFLNDRPYAKF